MRINTYKQECQSRIAKTIDGRYGSVSTYKHSCMHDIDSHFRAPDGKRETCLVMGCFCVAYVPPKV